MTMAGQDTHEAFNPAIATPAEWAHMYRRQGIQVLPGKVPDPIRPWKRPDLPAWEQLQHAIVPDFTFSRWYGEGGEFINRLNMGLLTGTASGRIIVIDLDEYKTPACLEWWQSVTLGIEPETWVQRTGGGG